MSLSFTNPWKTISAMNQSLSVYSVYSVVDRQ